MYALDLTSLRKNRPTRFWKPRRSWEEQPIVIQGAGAGAEVTARGVFGDILRLSKHIN